MKRLDQRPFNSAMCIIQVVVTIKSIQSKTFSKHINADNGAKYSIYRDKIGGLADVQMEHQNHLFKHCKHCKHNIKHDQLRKHNGKHDQLIELCRKSIFKKWNKIKFNEPKSLFILFNCSIKQDESIDAAGRAIDSLCTSIGASHRWKCPIDNWCLLRNHLPSKALHRRHHPRPDEGHGPVNLALRQTNFPQEL